MRPSLEITNMNPSKAWTNKHTYTHKLKINIPETQVLCWLLFPTHYEMMAKNDTKGSVGDHFILDTQTQHWATSLPSPPQHPTCRISCIPMIYSTVPKIRRPWDESTLINKHFTGPNTIHFSNYTNFLCPKGITLSTILYTYFSQWDI